MQSQKQLVKKTSVVKVAAYELLFPLARMFIFGSCEIYLFTCVSDNAFTEDILDWSSPGLGRPVFFMCLQGLLFFALIMFGETGKIQESWQSFMERAEGTLP